MQTIPRHALSAALKNQLNTAITRMDAAEADPVLIADATKFYDVVQRLTQEVRDLEYAVKLAETHERAFAMLVELAKTVRQLDTSATPERGESVNCVRPERDRRLNTPYESAECVLWELNRMGLVGAEEIVGEKAA